MRLPIVVIAMVLMAILLAPTWAQASHQVAADPAVREMKESMDRPRPSPYTAPVISESTSKAPALDATGRWHMELTGDITIDLDLNQSGNAVFGNGNVTTTAGSDRATASGRVSGAYLNMDIVPASGDELYSVSLFIGKLPLNGTYTRFAVGKGPDSGAIEAGWIPI